MSRSVILSTLTKVLTKSNRYYLVPYVFSFNGSHILVNESDRQIRKFREGTVYTWLALENSILSKNCFTCHVISNQLHSLMTG